MTKPVSILPLLDLFAILRGPFLTIAVVEFVFKGEECLLVHIAHVDGENARAAPLCFETQKPCGGAYVQDGCARNRDGTYIIFKTPAQVPVPAHHAKLRQFHRVIEVTVVKTVYLARFRQQRVAIGLLSHDTSLIP